MGLPVRFALGSMDRCLSGVARGGVPWGFIQCHPDSDPSNPLLHAQFVRINEAYKVLSKQSSRQDYDQILEAILRNELAYQSPYRNYRRPHSTTHTKRKQDSYNWYSKDNDSWYWSQFPPESDINEPAKERQERNQSIVWGCILLVFSSIFLHFFVFNTLRESRMRDLEEQQKKILDSYNKARENARINGNIKQLEILAQKQEERLKKLYGQDYKAK